MLTYEEAFYFENMLLLGFSEGYGACREDLLPHVRKPNPEELPISEESAHD